MSTPADSRSLKRGLSRDVSATDQKSPNSFVKRRKADIAVHERDSDMTSDRLDAVDEFLMGILAHPGSLVADQPSSGSSTTIASNTTSTSSSSTSLTSLTSSTSTGRSSQSLGASIPSNSEDSDNPSEDDPLRPTPPEDESSTTSNADKSKIPCRYHTLPGGCHRRNCRFSHSDGHGRCNICFEENVKVYALLSSCNHTFCFACAQRWRDTKTGLTARKCPLCRQISQNVVPSSTFYPIGPERDEHTVHYKQRLSKVPCRYFEASKSKPRRQCPFLNQCQFAHIVDSKPFLFTNKDIRRIKAYRRTVRPPNIDNQTFSRIRDRLRRRREEALAPRSTEIAELQSLRNEVLAIQTQLREESALLTAVEALHEGETGEEAEAAAAYRNTRLNEISRNLEGIYSAFARLNALEFVGSHLRTRPQTTANTTEEGNVTSPAAGTPSETDPSAMAVHTEDARLVFTDLTIAPVEGIESPSTVPITTRTPASSSMRTVTRSRSRRTSPRSAVSEASNVNVVANSVAPEIDPATSVSGGLSNAGEQSAAAAIPTAAGSTTTITTPPTGPLPGPAVIDREMVEARNRRWEQLRRRLNRPRGAQG